MQIKNGGNVLNDNMQIYIGEANSIKTFRNSPKPRNDVCLYNPSSIKDECK